MTGGIFVIFHRAGREQRYTLNGGETENTPLLPTKPAGKDEEGGLPTPRTYATVPAVCRL